MRQKGRSTRAINKIGKAAAVVAMVVGLTLAMAGSASADTLT